MKNIFKICLACTLTLLCCFAADQVLAADDWESDMDTGYGTIVGDLDSNGTVNNKDVEYLLWHTLFPADYSLNQDGNFDGVGSVDNKDVEYLLWHTLFPADYPLAEPGPHIHSYTEIVTAPTCLNEGYTTHKCSCGDTYTDNKTKALGHNYTSEVVKPTCTTSGHTKHTCNRCGTSYADTQTNATGHNYSVTSNTATCTTNGTKTETCSACGNKKTSTSNATGHVNTKTETKNATCIAAGYTKVTCKDCGTVISNTTIPSNGQHSYKTVRLSKAAQDNFNQGYYGYMKYSNYTDWNVDMCEGCYAIKEETIRFAYSDYEAAVIMLGYVNDLREEVYGTDEYNLTLDNSLLQLSKLRAQDLSFDYSHNGAPAGCGENIGQSGVNIYDHFVSWRNSSGHYANMINKNRTMFGYAIYVADSGRVYRVQLFQ